MTHQTNAQRLADVLDHFGASGSASKGAATELRRLSAIEQERDQLRAQLAALKDGQADPVGTVFTMEALGTPGRPMTETQNLRQALQAIANIDDTTNHSVDASAALDRIGQIARQALALPTAAPVGDRDAFERTMMDKFGWQRNDFKLDDFGYFDGHTDTAWMAWQARAALSAQAVPNPWRDAVIEQLESWHIYVPAIHENSPRMAIKALVNIETQAALDPKVSSQAAALAAGAVPDERDKVALSIATDALGEIALAGMSGTGQESEEAMRDWHARQAWKFIGIAARAKSAIDAAIAASAKGGAA